MKSFKEYINEAMEEWEVKFKPGTYSGVKVTKEPVIVKAQSSREAIVRAGKKLGMDKNSALTAKGEANKVK